MRSPSSGDTGDGMEAAQADAQAQAPQLCILSKQVHASERRWNRLVIPSAQLPHFQHMQAELNAEGSDFQIYVRDASGSTWRWCCRMVVQASRRAA